jgi:hypothetical protein
MKQKQAVKEIKKQMYCHDRVRLERDLRFAFPFYPSGLFHDTFSFLMNPQRERERERERERHLFIYFFKKISLFFFLKKYFCFDFFFLG